MEDHFRPYECLHTLPCATKEIMRDKQGAMKRGQKDVATHSKSHTT